MRIGAIWCWPALYVPGFGFRIRWGRFGGAALMIPPPSSSARALVNRVRLMVVGGPVVGFGAAAVAWILVERWGSGGVAAIGHAASAGMLALNVFALVPAATAGGPTDGLRLLRLARRSTAEAEADRFALIAEQLLVRPRDWSGERLERAIADAGTSVERASMTVLAAARDVDRGDLAAAEARLVEIRTPQLHRYTRASVALTLAGIVARSGDPARARAPRRREAARPPGGHVRAPPGPRRDPARRGAHGAGEP